MDTVIYLDVNSKEVSRKTVEGKGRRPNEKDKDGNFIIRIKEGFKLENGKVVPIPKKAKTVAPEAVKEEIKAPEKAVPEPVKEEVKEPEKTETFSGTIAPTVGTPVAPKDVKLVIYFNSKGQEIFRKQKGKGKCPKETDKDGNYVVRIKDEVLDKFMSEHGLGSNAPSKEAEEFKKLVPQESKPLSDKDAKVFTDMINEKTEPDEALKEAADKAQEQKVEPEEYEVSERRKKKLTIEPVYTVDEIVKNVMHCNDEIVPDEKGIITLSNGVVKHGIPDLADALPYNAVFSRIVINPVENSVKAWSLPTDKDNNYGTPDREIYGCLKL